MNDNQAKIICIFGKRGYGKSTFAHSLLSTNYLIYDSVYEYKQGKHGIEISGLYALTLALKENIKKIIYKPYYQEDMTDIEEFNLVCECMMFYGLNRTFLIEEIDLYSSPKSSPIFFDRMIKIGRHKNISLITTSRRPAEVSRLLTSQANEIHSFRITEPRDKMYLENYMSIGNIENLKIGQKLSYID